MPASFMELVRVLERQRVGQQRDQALGIEEHEQAGLRESMSFSAPVSEVGVHAGNAPRCRAPAWPSPRGRQGIRRAPRTTTGPPPRGRPARRPAPPGCAGSDVRRSPDRRCKTARDAGGSRSVASTSRPRPARRAVGGPRRGGTGARHHRGRVPGPAQVRKAAALSPSIWWHRAIRAKSFRVIESLVAEPARLFRRDRIAAAHSCRSTSIEPRLNRTKGSPGRSASSTCRMASSRSSLRCGGPGRRTRYAARSRRSTGPGDWPAATPAGSARGPGRSSARPFAAGTAGCG